jgi:hypothetical protein
MHSLLYFYCTVLTLLYSTQVTQVTLLPSPLSFIMDSQSMRTWSAQMHKRDAGTKGEMEMEQVLDYGDGCINTTQVGSGTH